MSSSVPDQSWHNPKSRWRGRMRWAWIMCIVSAFAMWVSGAIVAVGWLGSRRMDPDLMTWPLWMAVASIVCGVIFVIVGARYRKITQRVPLFDGRLCPWCRREMEERDDAVHCARCQAECNVAAVRAYWTDLALNSSSAYEWKLKNHPRHGSRWSRWLGEVEQPDAEAKMRRAWMIFAAVVDLAIIAALALIVPTTLQLAILSVLLLGLTVMLLMMGWDLMRPAARARFCTNCRYQLPPGEPPALRCPECASDWTKPAAVYSGSGRDTKRLQTAGCAATIVFAVALLFVAGPTRMATRLVPTDTLIERVLAGRGMFHNWRALVTRDLAPEERRRLAEGILEARLRDNRLHFQAPDWIMSHILAEDVDERFAHRYFDEMSSITLSGPEVIRVGETASLELHTVMRQSWVGGGQSLYVYFAGAHTDDRRVIAEPWELAETLSTFGHTRFVNGSFYDPARSPELRIEATEPGELTVTVTMWLAVDVVPVAGGRRVIDWKDDGSPVFVDSVSWSKPVVLEHTIDVRE